MWEWDWLSKSISLGSISNDGLVLSPTIFLQSRDVSTVVCLQWCVCVQCGVSTVVCVY